MHSLFGSRPRGRPFRYLLACALVALTTAVRFGADPYLHRQLPYMFYLASVVVATWLCGVDAGILATVAGAFAANYFFVPPRYELAPHGEDWLAMGTFSAVAILVLSFVGRSRRAERAVRELHAQTTAVLEQMRAATLAAEVGVWTWIPETNRMSVGANWRNLFGAPAEGDVTAETWVKAVHPDDRQRAVETLAAAWRDGRDFSTEYRVLRPDGTVRWIIDRGRRTCDATGRVIGMAGINVDMTERKAAEEALQEANRLKDEFLATLSHELRTPLTAIVGWSDMVRRGTLEPAQATRAMESIYRNAWTLSEMIGDVLDVSRIVTGKMGIEMQPVDLAAVLQAALDSVRSAADAKGVAIVGEFPAVPFPVSGDPTRLQQVFWNLLSNAIKFTPPRGQVRVGVRRSDGQTRAWVADTGIGISREFLPHVFERFRQKDSSTTRTHGGLGLGLAIVRHLVELHGGTVSVESAGEGQGATFTVTLPAHRFIERRHGAPPAVRRLPAVEPVSDDVPSLCGVRVLVVDDEREARDVAASVLRYHGASVELAANAAQALQRFKEFDPDVLLVDLAMPEIDGFMLIERIRKSGGALGAAVPAIAFTAYAREEDQRRALASGFQLHLAKPVDSRTLVRAVAHVQAERGSLP